MIKSFSKHLLNFHKEDLFKGKNRAELEWFCNHEEKWWFQPIEVNYKDKEFYYTPCCEQFYSKHATAHTHTRDKECRGRALKNGQALLKEINERIQINNTHSGSGDIINNITQNITIVDMSGNIKGLVKCMTVEIDMKESDRVMLYKQNLKLKKLLEENNIEYDSEVSDIISEYDSDTSNASRRECKYDPSKKLPEKYRKAFREIDLTRGGIKLRTKEQHDQDIADALEEKRLEEENAEFERREQIGNIKGRIKSLEDKIKRYEHQIGLYDEETLKYEGAKNDVKKLNELIKAVEKEIEESKKELRELIK